VPLALFARFLEAAMNPTTWPVPVHREQGVHRTGVLAAAYRVAVRRRFLAEATDEVQRLGHDAYRQKRR
jgi:protein tyrosine/serine phosphatase